MIASQLISPRLSKEIDPVDLGQRERKIKYTVEQSIDEGLTMNADRRSIKQILLNLLSNATKFTNEGGVITVRARKTSSAVTLSIRDTGIGIPRWALSKIGQPFEQVQCHFARSQGGSGLGLAISRSLPNCRWNHADQLG